MNDLRQEAGIRDTHALVLGARKADSLCGSCGFVHMRIDNAPLVSSNRPTRMAISVQVAEAQDEDMVADEMPIVQGTVD